MTSVTSAPPNPTVPTVAVATVIEVMPHQQSGMQMQAHEGHVIGHNDGGGKAAAGGWGGDKSLSEKLAELNHAKEAVREEQESRPVP